METSHVWHVRDGDGEDKHTCVPECSTTDYIPAPSNLSVTTVANAAQSIHEPNGKGAHGLALTYNGAYHATTAVFAGLKLAPSLGHLIPPSPAPAPAPAPDDAAPAEEFLGHHEPRGPGLPLGGTGQSAV